MKTVLFYFIFSATNSSHRFILSTCIALRSKGPPPPPCRLQTNSALVAALLRLKDNHCHLEETEHALKRDHKFAELIILYQTRSFHRKALEMLLRQSGRQDSSLFGFDRLVQYLQHLGEVTDRLWFVLLVCGSWIRNSRG